MHIPSVFVYFTNGSDPLNKRFGLKFDEYMSFGVLLKTLVTL